MMSMVEMKTFNNIMLYVRTLVAFYTQRCGVSRNTATAYSALSLTTSCSMNPNGLTAH